MNFINKFLSILDIQVNRLSSLSKEKKNYEKSLERIAGYYKHFNEGESDNRNTGIQTIVFSKNRAMQLHALLFSYFHYTRNAGPVKVIFTCSTGRHFEAYRILQEELKELPIEFVKETDFPVQLKKMVKSIDADRIFFMTDDGIFLDHFDLNDCLQYNPLEYIFSLRLGKDFTFCYSHNRKQEIPTFNGTERQLLHTWVWADLENSPDWSYPLSVDATIFWRKEIDTILDLIAFKSPSSLESQMQLYVDLFKNREGVCYTKTKYVNVPCNIVQNEFNNITTGTFSTDDLLQKFLNGQRINWEKLGNLNARDAQLVRFSFVQAYL